MRRFLFLLLATAAAATCADDPWLAVNKLASGTDVRVIKKGFSQPIIGKFAEANDDRILLVIKKEQISIDKDQIDRLDARPTGSRVKVEEKNTVNDPQAAKAPPMGMDNNPASTGTTSTASVSLGQKPDFETIYRRRSGAPKTPDTKK